MSEPRKRSAGSGRKRTGGEKKNQGKGEPAKSAHTRPINDTPANSTPVEHVEVVEVEAQLCPYDENLLERSRTQWQFGDWESLSHLTREKLQHHPDRAKLALLAAAGHLQRGDAAIGRQFARLALDWGAGKRLVTQILVAGVYNSLGRASAVVGRERHVLEHFRRSVGLGMSGGDSRLVTQARAMEQYSQLGQRKFPRLSEKMNELDCLVGPSWFRGQTVLPPPIIEKSTQEIASASPDTTKIRPAPIKENSQTQSAGGKKFSSDAAKLDEMIKDLVPFFYGKSITYVDVGAFVGEVLLKILHVGEIKIREAHLYEPNPESYNKLKQNLSECKISSIHIYNYAISSKSTKKKFSSAASMTKSIDYSIEVDRATNIFTADSFPLDDLSSSYTDGRIDLLKVDVEGDEIDVLQSAKRLLGEQKIDVIYIEAGLNKHGTQQTYLADIDLTLQGFGYRAFKIYEQVNEWMQDSPFLRRCNLVYMSSRFAEANPYKAMHEIFKLKRELAQLKNVTSSGSG